jgi:hypothetical protein
MLSLLIAPSALAREAHSHKGACSATRPAPHHAKRSGRCSHRGARKGKAPTHRTSQPKQTTGATSHKPTTPATRVPARCEDTSLPGRSSAGSSTCQDGSEPSCQDGSEPTRAAGATTLTCPAPKDGGEQEAALECSNGGESECGPTEPPCEPSDPEDAAQCSVAATEAGS